MRDIIETIYGLLSGFFVEKDANETFFQRFKRASLGVLIFLACSAFIIFCIVFFNKNFNI